ncbi:hypothetical protein [Labrys wisconsinensis]|uniref:Uncharacterized protein YwgA n=1 Tax=Labrys wisconsinensis TaxID=425677 RepID=A0ABU0JKG1_9HYPH|nr:hypothetical protein [Labrys wisconsinensis]MDQ0474768.1 uncharacterized protein YwgA [Labrys wisconsinensis]
MTIDVPSLVEAAGGEVVGKIRLQKIVYLLDQIGLNSGFSYEYHHYGPYSAGLAEQVEDDVVFGRLEAEQRRRQSDGVPYVAYRSRPAGHGEAPDGLPIVDRLHQALAEMQRRSATALELAATMHWLAMIEKQPDWQAELVRRKGAKTQNGRDQQALELLAALGLPPAVSPAAAEVA